MIYGLIAMIGWGVGNFGAAQLSRKIGALRAMLWNTIGVFTLMVLALPFLRQGFLLASWRDFFLLAVGGLLLTIGGVSYYKGVRLGKVSLVAPLAASWPMIIVLIALSSGREILSMTKGLGVSLIVVGTITAALKTRSSEKIFRLSDPGIGYALVALFAWSGAFYLFGITLASSAWLPANVFFMLWASIFTYLYSKLRQEKLLFSPTRTAIQYILLSTVSATVAFLAYSLGIRSSHTALTGAAANANPAITVLLAWIFLREWLTKRQLGGILAVMSGLILLAV